jgi:soluble lytic murein transglycosylase-like protein
MPATAKELGVKNPRDYNENIAGGKKYFDQLMKKYDNDRRVALAAYNWGMGNVDKAMERVKSKGLATTWDNIMRYASVPAETENYVAYIMREQGKIRNNPEGYWDKIFSRRNKQVTA